MAVDSFAIEKAIAAAELQTSGEIRVHIETICKGDVTERKAGPSERLDAGGEQETHVGP